MSAPALWLLNEPLTRRASTSTTMAPDVVPIAGVLLPGVAQTDDEERLGRHDQPSVSVFSSRTTPASASASSVSASTSSAVGASLHGDDQRLRIGDQGGAIGQRDVAGQELGAGLGALDVDGQALRNAHAPRPRRTACWRR